jgi:hypothetical protein
MGLQINRSEHLRKSRTATIWILRVSRINGRSIRLVAFKQCGNCRRCQLGMIAEMLKKNKSGSNTLGFKRKSSDNGCTVTHSCWGAASTLGHTFSGGYSFRSWKHGEERKQVKQLLVNSCLQLCSNRLVQKKLQKTNERI